MLAYMSHKKDTRRIWVNANIYNTDVNSGDPDQMCPFCGICSGSALFAYVPQKGHQAYMG